MTTGTMAAWKHSISCLLYQFVAGQTLAQGPTAWDTWHVAVRTAGRMGHAAVLGATMAPQRIQPLVARRLVQRAHSNAFACLSERA